MENTAGFGGAIAAGDGSITLNDCAFSGNSAESYGGGVRLHGVYGMLSGCTFTNNQVTNQGAGGGAMSNVNSTTSLDRCTFINNAGGNGGGLYNHVGSDTTLSNCVLSGNTASATGGAIWSYQSSVHLQNCTVAGNTAILYGGGFLTAYGGTSSSVNTVFWGNDAPEGPEIHLHDALLSVAYNNVQDGQSGGVFVDGSPDQLQWGPGNIDADPQFVDLGNNDVHLLPGSPCIDVGDNTVVQAGQTDIDGHPRTYDGDDLPPPIVDIGADEFAPDCNFNGVPDDQEIAAGTSQDTDGDGVPDECVACVDNIDCGDDNPCTYAQCVAGWCDIRSNVYGDADLNGVPNVFDIFCILDGIAGDFTNCTFEDGDIHPCEPDAVLNIFDVLAALGAIAGEDPCCGGG
jgi:hypothetical protein